MIRQDSRITGIDINDQVHTISLFADDVMIYLYNPVESIGHLMEVLDGFGLCSGYKININKMQALMFNCAPSQDLKKWRIKLEAKSIKYLGVNLTKNLSELYQK